MFDAVLVPTASLTHNTKQRNKTKHSDGEGYCFLLPPAGAGSPLQQIDLSDDMVVAQLFANQ